MPTNVDIDQRPDQFLRSCESEGDLTYDDFLLRERHILQLAGLAGELADKHLRSALRLYESTVTPIVTRSDVMRGSGESRRRCLSHPRQPGPPSQER